MSRYSWTQPQCEVCWYREHLDSPPITLREEYQENEVCCTCGNAHTSGIYIRVNPLEVPYPTREKGGGQ